MNNLTEKSLDEMFAQYVLEHGIACGGNWVAMLQSALQTADPDLVPSPEVMEVMEGEGNTFSSLCTLIRCAITRREMRSIRPWYSRLKRGKLIRRAEMRFNQLAGSEVQQVETWKIDPQGLDEINQLLDESDEAITE